jgi:hypothetical protein
VSARTGAEAVEQQRQAFAVACWAARVECDPAEDFDGFVETLWRSVEICCGRRWAQPTRRRCAGCCRRE